MRERNPAGYIILIRLAVGIIFFSEGIQKFLFPAEDGVGRFIRIGIPYPQFFAPFDGVVEIVCGLLILLGFFTRIASIPLIIDMIVAIISTKIPILFKNGFWTMMHEARVDLAMILGTVFLLMVGSGKYSLDRYFSTRHYDGILR